jgi:ribonuclease HI
MTISRIAFFDGECLNNDSDPSKRKMRACYVIGEKRYIAEAGHPIPSNNVAKYMGLISLLDYIYTERPKTTRWFPGPNHDCDRAGCSSVEHVPDDESGGKVVQSPTKKYVIMGDSQLVINQMTGAFRTKNPALIPLRDSARVYVARLVHVEKLDIEFRWVPRKQNLAGKLLEAAHHNKWVRRDFRKSLK